MLGKLRGEFLQNTNLEHCGWLQELSMPFKQSMSNNVAVGFGYLKISSRFTSIFIGLYYCVTPGK